MRKKIGFLIAFVAILSMLLVPAGALAVDYDTTLVLENKDGDWNEITGDTTIATLQFNSAAPEFQYSLVASGLEATEEYALIYYADRTNQFVDWGGDNPGAVIAVGTSDTSGGLNLVGIVDLHMNLPCEPDINTGAKIWLLPTDMLSLNATLPVIDWEPSRILYEHELITYTDTSFDARLVLENKDAVWNEIPDDGISGVVWYDVEGPKFRFEFTAQGLAADTDYSLIYYADPWPGDSGIVLAVGTSDGDGVLSWQSDSMDTGDLPCVYDGNYPDGAKIWLVPSAFLTDGDKFPMVGFDRVSILFEHNLITYTKSCLTEWPTDQLFVAMRFGYDIARYTNGNQLATPIEAMGEYNGFNYMLCIPAGCIVDGAAGTINWMWLDSIIGDTLTFVGKLYKSSQSGEWIGDGEFVKLGTFTEITGGKAYLE